MSNSLEVIGTSSRGSLCKGLGHLKMKDVVGRPRKLSKILRNPIEIGCGLKKGLGRKITYKKIT